MAPILTSRPPSNINSGPPFATLFEFEFLVGANYEALASTSAYESRGLSHINLVKTKAFSDVDTRGLV